MLPQQYHYNHSMLQNAQSNAFQSKQLLKNLKKYFPQQWANTQDVMQG